MLARIKINNDLWIEKESDNEGELFKAISRITEIFKHPKCGKCGCTEVKYVCRKDKSDNDWLEVVCTNYRSCGAKLVFGQTKGKSGDIYPKTRWNNLSETQKEQRADAEEYANNHKGYLEYGGWFIFDASKLPKTDGE